MKIITAQQAAGLVESGSTVCSEGIGGNAHAEELLMALGERFAREGAPAGITMIHTAGQGDHHLRGLNHLAQEGLLACVIGGHYNPAPGVQRLVNENKIKAYNMPQGVLSVLYRDIAAKRPGTITRVGLHTFVDPRMGGGRLNAATTEDIVEVITLRGQEYLLYHPHHLDYALLRGTYADERGNVTMEQEACTLEALSAAQAVKNCGGTVIVQVKRVVKNGSLDPRRVKIPGILVDYVVPVADVDNHMQTFDVPYDPALCGDTVASLAVGMGRMPLDARKIISRRAAMELAPGAVINLGIGIPEGVAAVAREEGIFGDVTLTIESGPIGGIPVSGIGFGAALNPEAIIDQNAQFDFYDGGGLDAAFLGLAEVDGDGSINVSRFGSRIAGAGGFINITQSTRKVVFCGTFTAKGLRVQAADGRLSILNEGAVRKFVKQVEQITFNGKYAAQLGQEVLYITERAVFALRGGRLTLVEKAPGIDVQSQILDLMDCTVAVAQPLCDMDPRIFHEEDMGLALAPQKQEGTA